MQRYQSEPLDRPIPLMPAASPVDRLLRPVAPTEITGQSTASQLAEALSQINPAIKGFIEQKITAQDDQATAQGRAMRLQTALNYRDAVSKGIITPDQNPFFVKAWKEQDGKVTADRYNADLTVALATGPMAANTDPSQIQPQADTFRQNWMKANIDPDSQSNQNFMQGFSAHANAYDMNAMSHQATEVGARMVNQVDQNTHNQIFGILSDGQTRGLTNESMADGINNVLDTLNLSSAMPYKKSNQVVLDELAEQAYTNKDMRVFGVMNSIKTGSGYLGQTKAAQDLMRTTQEHIASALAATDDHSHKMDTWEREDTERSAQANINTIINQNDQQGKPTDLADVADELARLNKANPSAASEMRTQVLESGKPHAQFDSLDAKYSLEDDLWSNNLTSDKINAAYRSGQITQETSTHYHQALVDNADKKEAKNLAASHYAAEQERQDRPKDIAQVPTYQADITAINTAFAGDPNKQWEPKLAQLKNAVIDAYRASLMGWIKNHPKYDPGDLYDASRKFRDNLIKQFSTVQIKGPNAEFDPLIAGANAATEQVRATPATTQRLYGSPQAWAKAKSELSPGSDLALKLQAMHMTNAQVQAYIKAQDALYNSVPPKP